MVRIVEIPGLKCKDCDIVVKMAGQLICPISGSACSENECCSVGDDYDDYIEKVTEDYRYSIDSCEIRIDELRDCNSELSEALEKMTAEKEELEAQLSIEREIRR